MEENNVSFLDIRSRLMDVLKKRKFEDDEFQQILTSVHKKDMDYHINVDQLIREILTELIADCDNGTLEKYVRFVLEICRLELCSPTLPAILLGDIFDVSTLDRCEQLFSLVGNNISVWKEDFFFTACKNNILRMCNDLLRRLSRSRNTIFSGRILVFLAKFFPFSERSGLNVVSEFNTDNITEFTNDIEIEGLTKSVNSIQEDDGRIKLDYTIYSKFWSLQEYFRCPNNCYNKPKWNLFCAYTNSILTTFSLYKLDEISNYGKESDMSTYFDINQDYFAKYLTNQRLIELQFADSNFRRCVLVQYLILFQYLNAPVRFKPETFEFKPEQIEWLKQTEDKVYKLIEETSPNGKSFSKTIRHMLQREEHWNQWKNDGCPELKRPSIIYTEDGTEIQPSPHLPKKERLLGDIMKEFDSRGKFYLGNRQLTKLWNVNPNNLEACTGEDRNFVPTLEDYFQTVLDEANPENMIEPGYRKVNDKDYCWRGLRLLSGKSPYFFAQNNAPIHDTSEYIENTVSKILKERQSSQPLSAPCSLEPKIELNQESQDFIHEEGEVETQAVSDDDSICMKSDAKSNIVSKEQLDQVALLIVDDWRILAARIGLKPDEVEFFATERQTDEERARYLLQSWYDDSEDRSADNLADILESANLFEVANILKSNDDNRT